MFLTIDQICERLMVSRTVVLHLIKTGELRAMKVGTQYRITESDFGAYCEKAMVS